MNGVSGGAVRELPTQGGLRYFTGAQSLLRLTKQEVGGLLNGQNLFRSACTQGRGGRARQLGAKWRPIIAWLRRSVAAWQSPPARASEPRMNQCPYRLAEALRTTLDDLCTTPYLTPTTYPQGHPAKAGAAKPRVLALLRDAATTA